MALAESYSHEPGTALLLSGGFHDASRRSLLWLFPVEKIVVHGASAWEQLQERLGPGSWVGYLGFEMGTNRVAPTPSAYFQRCAVRVEWEHASGVASVWVDEEAALPRACLVEQICRGGPLFSVPAAPSLLKVAQGFDEPKRYMDKVEAVRELIRQGEVYQVCLSQEAWLEGHASPISLFRRMHERNPAPFSAFINCGEFAICSSSPERFLSLSEGQLEARPIKGTAPRGLSPADDERVKRALQSSPKERSELTMITDLLRNDLGSISEIGSVQVMESLRCESYTNVHHLVSVIRSQKRSDVSTIGALRALFPGGSISGCPKLRALEVIRDIEQRPRGVYTGAIGYIEGDAFDFSMAIRTLIVWPDRINIQLGGAIVYDSDPCREYEETLHKGKTLFQALGVQP